MPEKCAPGLPVELSDLVENDIGDVLHLSGQLGLSPWSLGDYLEELRLPEAYLWVARTGGEFVGFLAARRIPGQTDGTFDAEIYNIGVRKSRQRHGIGGMLMERLLRKCKADAVQTIWLEVRQNNPEAIAFYKGFGFVECGFRPDFYRDPADNALIMKISLDPEPVNFP